MYIFRKNKRYKKYEVRIIDFIWVDVDKLHIPWYPLCEMDKSLESKELCPVTADLMKKPDGTVDTKLLNSPHVELLKMYDAHKDKVFDMEFLKGLRYYMMHKGWRERGINASIRTDDWILKNKVRNFIKLYLSVKEKGYLYEGVNNNFISVLDRPLASKRYGYKRDINGYELFDGGHRAACLHNLGYKKIKTLLLT